MISQIFIYLNSTSYMVIITSNESDFQIIHKHTEFRPIVRLKTDLQGINQSVIRELETLICWK